MSIPYYVIVVAIIGVALVFGFGVGLLWRTRRREGRRIKARMIPFLPDEDDDGLTCDWCGDVSPPDEMRHLGDERVCEICYESRHDCRMCDGSGGGMYENRCPACHGSGTDRASVEREHE